jgi:hypothetical protein
MATFPSTTSASDVWDMMDVYRAEAGDNWPSVAPSDPYFNYVSLLLHGDGANGAQNNTFLDASANAFSITRNGNTTQGSFSPYGDDWSNYFDGTGDYLSVPSSTGFELTGDFTIEMWIFKTKSTGAGQFDGLVYRSADWRFKFQQSDNVIYYDNGTDAQLINYTGSTPMLNNWHHLAFVRSGTTLTGYVDGVSYGSATVAGAFSASGAALIIADNPGSSAFGGYISNLRIVKGTAVYTSNFNPPTAPLTDITNTQLLTCQSNRFIDNSVNSFTITRFGDTSVQRFNPFGAPAAYSAATIGGSGYFDGNGDYLSIADNANLQFGTGDFTIECWANLKSLTAGNPTDVLSKMTQATSSTSWVLGANPTNSYWGLHNYSAWILTGETNSFVADQWTHLVVTRSGTTARLFVNGRLSATATVATNFSTTANVYIGYAIDFNYANGYISGTRLIKGSIPTSYQTSSTTVGTQIFTPPSSPPTTSSDGASSSDVKLLVNYTNAGIYDNAEMADLETVGNAQVSTSVVKYGTGSMYFDGSGDWLAGPPTPQTDLGSGNFTIECWLYRTASGAGSDSGIVSRGAPGNLNGFVFAYTSSNVLTFNFNYSGAIVTGSTAIPLNTWTHVAVTRSGTTFRLFVNGTVDATNTSSNSQTLNAGDIFYVGRSGYDSSRIVTGYIDDLRLTKGYARYTSNFTPPTEAFPNFWEPPPPPSPPSTVEYLVVAGGGGAGGVSGDASGGGGAGGYRTAVGYAVSTGSPITVTVGGGGNGGAGGGANDGTQGSSSVFGTITSAGGGYGGGGASGGTVQRNGGSGGSGGGGSNSPATGGAGNTPSTSPSQGNNGGNYYAGGGGAGGAGSATAFNGANNGGIGVTSSISGASVNYAGGGCGGGSQGNAYGGGNGEYNVGAGNNTAGTANTGGGGGGCWNSGTRAGANGGSGVVIIRYADTYAAASATTGSPTVTVTGGYRIYKWTGSGSITF